MRLRRRRPGVLISAHRCNTLEAVEHAIDLGVDYVEFDVQRCNDGEYVLAHDGWIDIGGHQVPVESLTAAQVEVLVGTVVRFDDVLAALAGRAKAHVDLKFHSPDARYATPASTYEVEAVRRALDTLGPGNLLVTTLDDPSVRAVRDWSDEHEPSLLVGLSLGRSVRGLRWWRQVEVRVSELLPRLRYAASRANLVVAKHTLARLGVAVFARRQHLPLLVWTVDTEESLRYWLRPGRAFLVTTNAPGTALRIRDEARDEQGRHPHE